MESLLEKSSSNENETSNPNEERQEIEEKQEEEVEEETDQLPSPLPIVEEELTSVKRIESESTRVMTKIVDFKKVDDFLRGPFLQYSLDP